MQQNRVARWIRYSNPSVTAQKRCAKQKYFNILATATVTQVHTSLFLATCMSVCVHTYYRVGEQNRDLPVIPSESLIPMAWHSDITDQY